MAQQQRAQKETPSPEAVQHLKYQITTMLAGSRQHVLADTLGISYAEMSRKFNGERGWWLEELATGLLMARASVIQHGGDEVVTLPRREWEALVHFANCQLNELQQRLENPPMFCLADTEISDEAIRDAS